MNPPVSILPPPGLASRKRRRRPLISLTPLIDVVFILLIFFMLASSFLDWRAIELGMPAATAGGAPGGKARLIEEIAETQAVDPAETRLVAQVVVEEAVVEEPAIEEATVEEPVVEETVAEPVRQTKAPPVVTPPPPRPQQTQETANAVERPAREVRPAAPATPGAGGKAGMEESPDAGSADDSSGGGLPGATADYMARLQAWLENHKQYPRAARLRQQEGTVLLSFVMDRNGRVLEYRIERTSGHTLLDREVEDMVERAQPLPRMPDEMREARLELIVPVQFFLR